MNEPSSFDMPSPVLQRRWNVNWALTLAIVAIVLTVGVWVSGRDQSRGVKTDLARKLAESDAAIQESRLLARNADELARNYATRLSQIESQIGNSREQQLALEALYKELASDRDQWVLADIEHSVLGASQQLQQGGNIKAAIVGLETADQRLARLDKPQFARLRQAIANDLARLRAQPTVDEAGISYTLVALGDKLNQLPLSSAHTRQQAKAAATGKRFGQGLLEEFKNLIQIRRIDQNEPALLNRDQEYYLRNNLKLHLLTARLSLLSRDSAGYQADLKAAQQLLSRYFNTSDTGVAAALDSLRGLARLDVAPPVPELNESLAAVQSFRQKSR